MSTIKMKLICTNCHKEREAYKSSMKLPYCKKCFKKLFKTEKDYRKALTKYFPYKKVMLGIAFIVLFITGFLIVRSFIESTYSYCSRHTEECVCEEKCLTLPKDYPNCNGHPLGSCLKYHRK